MLKRIYILVLILCALMLLAMSPNHQVTAASENAPKLQATVVVTVPVGTIPVVTSPPESTPGTIPVTGSQPSMSTLIIFGLLAILALAVLIGGVALVNRRQS